MHFSPNTTTSSPPPSPDDPMTDITDLLAPPCNNETPPILPPEDVCEGGVNCTLVTSNPGATIIWPLFLSLAGVTGHIWALCYLYSSHRRSNTHTVFYLLLCTLIWTDFFGKVSTTPPALISYAFGRWMGGREMCHLHGFTMILVQEVTHLTVAAMAVERLLAICHGYLYERLVTFSRCWYLLASIWVSSLLVCLLPLFGVGEFYLQYPFTWCFINIHVCPSTPLRHRLFTTAMGSFNAGCLLVIVICNVCVVGTLLRMRLSRKIPAHLCSRGRRASVQRDQELQMVVLLLVITFAFVLSWAPVTRLQCCYRLWPPHVTREDHMEDLVAIRLVSINQILDPWVYIICRVLFKSKAWQCWRRVLMEGRRWSRRRHSHSLKLKHSHPDFSPSDANPPSSPSPQPPIGVAGEDNTHLNGAPTWRPPNHSTATTHPHHHHHHHNHHQPHQTDGFFGDDSLGLVGIGGDGGDAGGGSGVAELPPLPPPPPLPLPRQHLDEFKVVEVPRGGDDGGDGDEASTPLTRSVSVAIPTIPTIPIPLFICEHYTMGHIPPAPTTPATQQGGVTRARSCCLDHHHHHHHLPLPLPLPPMPSEVWGVPRSRSWGSGGGCGGGGGGGATDRPPQRSSSTQTLPGGASLPFPLPSHNNAHTASKGEG